MKPTKETKIGLIVLVGIALLFWGLNFLKGKDIFTSDNTMFAVYDQVEGLAASNPVLVNGLKIGLIRKLRLMEDGSGRILVALTVTNKVHLPVNSKAEIFSTDILGSKGIRILMGDSKDLLKDGDTLISGVQKSLPEEVNAQVAPIKAKAENLLSSMDSVLLVIREVFNQRTKSNLKNSFESISKSLSAIEHIATNLDTVLEGEDKLKKIFENIESISTNFKNNNEKLTTIINNFAAISDTIARSNISETLESTKRTLEQTAGIMEKVNKGEGSLGQLANNDSLYNNLNSTARNLDLLLSDFKENPGRYVNLSFISFGRKAKK
jgi:phospholipid/cholesterol/gamma-HCH transport system substrate-binding protein